MIHLLKLIIFGHVHKWETVGQSTWKRLSSGSEKSVEASGPRFVCRCETCGSYKAFDL